MIIDEIVKCLSPFYYNFYCNTQLVSFARAPAAPVLLVPLFNGESSSLKEAMLGVPQGPLLGPKLYSLHVSDLPLAITQGEIYLFADDATFYCTGKDVESVVVILNYILNEYIAGAYGSS